MLNRPGAVLLIMLALLSAGVRSLMPGPANAQPPASEGAVNGTSFPASEDGGPPEAAKAGQAPKAKPEQDRKKEAERALEENAQSTLELALKAISLSQGEGGFEVWRLKAEWANMQREDGKIVVQRPKLTYFLKEDGKTLLVTSDTGVIDQKEQLLTFDHNVRITQDDKSVEGDLLVYDGTAKTMTFPRGGDFTGTGVSGSAANVVWDINRQTITAVGDVLVFFAGAD